MANLQTNFEIAAQNRKFNFDAGFKTVLTPIDVAPGTLFNSSPDRLKSPDKHILPEFVRNINASACAASSFVPGTKDNLAATEPKRHGIETLSFANPGAKDKKRFLSFAPGQDRIITDTLDFKQCFGGVSLDYFERFKPVATATPPVSNTGGFLPDFLAFKSGKTIVHVAFDWIKWSGKMMPEFLLKTRKKLKMFDGKCPTMFELHYDRGHGFGKVADLVIMTGAGQKGWCSIELENRVCYWPVSEIRELIDVINLECGIEFKHYTRLDVALDMQKTDYRGISCQDFMDKVGRGEYAFKGKLQGWDGDLGAYEEMEEARCWRRRNGVQTVYAGRRKSGFSMTMYNKSLEMRKKGGKPYISEAWKEAGLLPGFDTYRIEFSHMKDCKQYISCGDDAEMMVHNHTDIDLILKLKSYASALYKYHFQVAIDKRGVRWDRLRKVNLLNNQAVMCVRERATEKLKSHNHLKYMVKNVCLEGLKAHAAGAKIYATELFRFVHNMVERHGLEAWYEKNLKRYGLNELNYSYEDWRTNKDMLDSRLFVQPEINYLAFS